MIVLRDEELACTDPDGFDALLDRRLLELADLQQRRDAAVRAGEEAPVGSARRARTKRTSTELNGVMADVRTVIGALRAARRRATENADLLRRGHVPRSPVWPRVFDGRQRSRSRGGVI